MIICIKFIPSLSDYTAWCGPHSHTAVKLWRLTFSMRSFSRNIKTNALGKKKIMFPLIAHPWQWWCRPVLLAPLPPRLKWTGGWAVTFHLPAGYPSTGRSCFDLTYRAASKHRKLALLPREQGDDAVTICLFFTAACLSKAPPSLSA